jgi:putative ABC transport system permease protein
VRASGTAVATTAAPALVKKARRFIGGGVSPSDPLTFISLTVVLVIVAIVAIVALAACYIPAHRAMRVDHIVALREA